MTSAALHLSSELDLPLEVVTEATAIVATRGAGKSSASAVFVEEAFALDVQSVVLDRTGVYHGLRSNARGNGPGLGIYVLGGPHGDAPLEANAGVLIADLIVDTGHSFVLDLSDFSKSAAVRFAADLLERLYDRKARNRSTTLLVIDEAHFYAPQTPRGGFKGDSARLMGAMEDVVGLGRSRGLGVVLTTQRTQALNKAILDLIETLLVMRMLSPRARDAVRLWIQEKHEDDELGVIATLDSLPTGTAWVWSPLRGILVKAPIRRIRTFDSYATPKPGETRVEPTRRAELDLASLGEQIRATAERAKENDPAELRKRIRELETSASQAAELDRLGWRKTEPREVVVEVPVFPEPLKNTIRVMLLALGETVANAKTQIDDAVRATEELGADFDRALIIETSGREKVPARASSAPRQAERTCSVRPSEAARPAVGTAAAPRPETNGHVELGYAAREIIATLASHHPLRLTIGQVALLSGRKPRGGSWNTAMREIRDGGLVDDDGSTLALTDAGIDAAGGETNSAANGPDRWRAALPTASREVFDYLVERWPKAVTFDEISEALGRVARGGSWNTAIATLVRNGLAARVLDGLAATEEAVGR